MNRIQRHKQSFCVKFMRHIVLQMFFISINSYKALNLCCIPSDTQKGASHASRVEKQKAIEINAGNIAKKTTKARIHLISLFHSWQFMFCLYYTVEMFYFGVSQFVEVAVGAAGVFQAS